MANTIQTLRPGSLVINDGGSFTPQPGGSLVTNLTDNTDTTWDQLNAFPGSGTRSLVMLMNAVGGWTPPAYAQIRSITARSRYRSDSYVLGSLFLSIAGLYQQADQMTQTSGSAINFTGTPRTTRGDGSSWDSVGTWGLQLHMSFNGSYLDNTVYWYEAYVDIAYNQAPTATATLPTGSVTATNTPSVTWSYSDPEADLQERVQVKIFDNAVATAGGFNPDTSTYIQYSGEIFQGGNSWTTAPLASGTTYISYVRVCDVGSSGRYGPWTAGPTFSIAASSGIMFDKPANPTVVSATPDATNNRFAILLQGLDNDLARNQSSAETGAAGWTGITNMTALYPQRTVAANQFLNGQAGLIMRPNAAGVMAMRSTTAVTLAALKAEAVRVVVGQARVALASFRAPAITGRTATLTLTYYNSAGTQVGSPVTGSGATILTSGWVQASVLTTVPATAVYETLTVTVSTPAAGGSGEDIAVDQLGVSPGTSTIWTRGGLAQDIGSVLDTFTRADSASVLGTSEGFAAQAWSALAGTWGISSNRAYTVSSTANAFAILASPTLADGVISVDITTDPTAAATLAGVVFRATDVNNLMWVDISNTNGVELWKKVGGTANLLASVAFTLGASVTVGLKVEYYGGRIQIYVDRKQGLGFSRVIDFTLVAGDITALGLLGNSGVGLYNYTATVGLGTRFDNFVAGNPVTQKVTVQRSIDAGVTWASIREGLLKTMVVPGQTLTVYDYEIAPGVTPQYRAYITATEATQPTAGGGVTVQSDNSSAVAASGPIVLTDWWLKDPLDSTKNTIVKIQGPIGLNQKEPVQIYEPLGRSTSVYVTDGVKGISGQLSIWSKTKAEYDKIRALTMQGRVLQLQDPFNRSWYIKINGDQQWQMITATKLATETTPLRHFHQVSFGFDEVSAPAVG